MTIANSDFDRVRNRRALYSVALLAVALILFGVWIATEIEDLVCYGMIVAAALLPAGLWISTGARGIPIIPTTISFWSSRPSLASIPARAFAGACIPAR